MKRRTAREKALQALFQIDFNEVMPDEAITNILEGQEIHPYLKQLVHGVEENKEDIDELIRQHLENWKIERLAKVDLTILRIAVFELQFLNDIPKNVVLNEAIEIAKRFGDEQSSKFINGVLSKMNVSGSFDD
ncbi:transcription antitermination factor NusB [Bacillus chungangensis]|uniref:Transcription antitermination protein NusB n=1 Tax=Bacillus chungangensis TaxID=587633 RepID=A0ABT9WPC5_9BACI|nr:transcription antitermination factor NusB [Bacillus chungangensis]MDQ0175135.1 N utilization substance protein B [Bacillus chungangensis]